MEIEPPAPGWGKFIKTVVKLESRLPKRRRLPPLEKKRKKNLQKKKNGRGWIHRF